MIIELDSMILAKWLLNLEINAAFVKRESSQLEGISSTYNLIKLYD